MKVLHGNLFDFLFSGDPPYDVLVHGCNCFHTFGRGFAKAVKQYFPTAFEADRQTKYGDLKKLGTFSKAEVEFINHQNQPQHLTIVNAYTQWGYGGVNVAPTPDPCNPFPNTRVQFHYTSFHSILTSLNRLYPESMFIMPAIGCGLAFGQWSAVSRFIEEILGDRATVVLD